MQTDLIYIDDDNERFLSYTFSNQISLTNNRRRMRMKRLAESVISTELTPMQQYCVTEHYLCGKKQKEIAEQLGLSRSTVSRHIGAGMKKLKHAAQLQLSALEPAPAKHTPALENLKITIPPSSSAGVGNRR